MKTEYHDDHLNTFFREDVKQWKTDSGKLSVWDQRESLALNIRPWEYDSKETQSDLTIPHMYLDAQDLWYNGKETMIRIMDYIGLTIDPQRLEKWCSVYEQWQQIQFKILRFCWNIDYIVDCIINNRAHDLSQYNMSFTDEAIIQHELIYKHGLTFKAWGLEKLPDNTQLLHELLEPNVYHKVDDIYNLL
jgi:hypothetical protein